MTLAFLFSLHTWRTIGEVCLILLAIWIVIVGGITIRLLTNGSRR